MQYEDTYRLAYIRGPEGIIVALASNSAKACLVASETRAGTRAYNKSFAPHLATSRCKDSQLITPSVSAVAVRNGLTDWRLRSRKHVDVMTLAAAGRRQPRLSQLTNGRIV
jgi:hypothetical protein